MPAPNVALLDSILNGYRGIRTVAVAAEDITFDEPVTVRAATAGSLVVVDMLGNQHTFNSLTAGQDLVGPGDGLLFVTEIKGASSVTSVIVGTV